MAETFRVRVEGLRFAAGHFATYGGECEPLHGHDYEVAAAVEGGLDANSWVVDFGALKALLRGLCAQLDHRFLLQGESRLLTIEETEAAWKVRTPAGADYILPRQDVLLLDVDNTTAERLAEWLSGKLWQSLLERGAENVRSVTVEVWEGPGQLASHRREAGPGRASGGGP